MLRDRVYCLFYQTRFSIELYAAGCEGSVVAELCDKPSQGCLDSAGDYPVTIPASVTGGECEQPHRKLGYDIMCVRRTWTCIRRSTCETAELLEIVETVGRHASHSDVVGGDSCRRESELFLRRVIYPAAVCLLHPRLSPFRRVSQMPSCRSPSLFPSLPFLLTPRLHQSRSIWR